VPADPHTPRPPLDVAVQPERTWVRIVPRGELDLAGAPLLSQAIEDLRDVGFRGFRIDLRELTFMDSSGVHSLLDLSAERDLDVVVVPGPPQVQRVLELTGVVNVLRMAAVRRPALTERFGKALSTG
jgi:anti-anti-sigma factor